MSIFPPGNALNNKAMQTTANTIETYIAGFPPSTQQLLQQMRNTIHDAAPDAKEVISYAIPTFNQQGNLVHFAGYKNHIGFYPGAGAIVDFQHELSMYHCSKGTIQFPINKPLPLRLIAAITKYRVNQNLEKAARKKTAKNDL